MKKLIPFILILVSCKVSKNNEIVIPNNNKWTEFADSFGVLDIVQPTLQSRLNVQVSTQAVSGSCIANGFDDAEGDGVHRPGFIERLPAVLASGSDNVLMITGGNDWYYSVPIGIVTDTAKRTYYGALNFIAQQVAKSPQIKMVWVTMIQRNTLRRNGSAAGNMNYAAQKAYVDAMIDVANKYHIKVINAFMNSGITYDNSNIYTSDGAHPTTAAGETLYANFVVNSILTGQ
ncbi:MAG TPA: GDSL-type esterase/lipase family protein [Mucilaginibacter sp.]|nr:GDSL-type esterase/lipase family protein [Mucilaginibacter sp.]